MASTSKDLGIATAYGYAKSKGYLGTEEEFATLMASYATVGQRAVDAKDDAEDARDAAVAAKTAAEAAAATCAPLAETFSESTAYAAGDYVVYNGALYRFTTAHAAGAWVGTDAEETTLTEDVTSLNQALNVFDDNLPGTVQTVNFGSDGKPASVVHTKNGATVRTDTYTWGTGTVTETRTLASGAYVTMVTDLTTLVTTISEIQEAS